MQERLLEILMQRDEITWQTLIYDLVKSEEMNPWDININYLAEKYLDSVKILKEHNFFISGKIILAVAILLKLKSEKLMDEDLAYFDSLLFNQNQEEDLNLDAEEIIYGELPRLAIKTPLARKRKVSVEDLVQALEKALEVDKRRVIRRLTFQAIRVPKLPEKKIDITSIIRGIFEKIKSLFTLGRKVTFSILLPESPSKQDKILTLVPLLHLSNESKINLDQKEHFGEIEIELNEKKL